MEGCDLLSQPSCAGDRNVLETFLTLMCLTFCKHITFRRRSRKLSRRCLVASSWCSPHSWTCVSSILTINVNNWNIKKPRTVPAATKSNKCWQLKKENELDPPPPLTYRRRNIFLLSVRTYDFPITANVTFFSIWVHQFTSTSQDFH